MPAIVDAPAKVALPAELTHRNAREYLQHAQAVLNAWQADNCTVVAVDVQLLQQFDSSALAVLLELRRRVHALNLQFSLVGGQSRLMNLARVYGVDQLFAPEPLAAPGQGALLV
jgi:phospholipid transport system transporter-binding protein